MQPGAAFQAESPARAPQQPSLQDAQRATEALPEALFRYVLSTGCRHQAALVVLTSAVFLIEVVPLELQRRVVNDLVKHRAYGAVVLLCALYAGAAFAQGGIKLAVNIYRSWVGERAVRDLRRRVYAGAASGGVRLASVDLQGTAAAMIVAEVEPIGGFVGSAIAEPLLQGGILASVFAYLIHLDPWLAAVALLLFTPQLVFVPLMQRGMNRRVGARVAILRQIGAGVLAPYPDRGGTADSRIDRVFQVNMGVFKLKFTMNFLMNLATHLQVVAALLYGGWLVHSEQIEVGAVVAFISAIGRLNDPWGDLVNYFREVNFARVKYGLLTGALRRSAMEPPMTETRSAS